MRKLLLKNDNDGILWKLRRVKMWYRKYENIVTLQFANLLYNIQDIIKEFHRSSSTLI
jgi:hypothetical protein